MSIIECEVSSQTYLKWLFFPIKKSAFKLMDLSALKAIFVFVVTFIGYVFHENVIGIGILLGLVVIDQITGVWLALKKESFSSGAFRNGLIKLLFYMLIIAAFHSLPKISPLLFTWMHLDTGAMSYLAATEVISITENSYGIMGLPFPYFLTDKLRRFINFEIMDEKKRKKIK